MPAVLRQPFALLLTAGVLSAQAPDAQQVAQERAQAELEVPTLTEVLELKPGMVIADVGAGFGAMTVVLGKWVDSGHVYPSEIGARQLEIIRDYVTREGLRNVTVLEGAAASTNLPPACCDAIVLRNVYHHITAVEAFNKSVATSLKPGGRVAVIDAVATPGSKTPEGVPANRAGHGVGPSVVVEELKAAGLVQHVRTIDKWPPGDTNPVAFLAFFRRP